MKGKQGMQEEDMGRDEQKWNTMMQVLILGLIKFAKAAGSRKLKMISVSRVPPLQDRITDDRSETQNIRELWESSLSIPVCCIVHLSKDMGQVYVPSAVFSVYSLNRPSSPNVPHAWSSHRLIGDRVFLGKALSTALHKIKCRRSYWVNVSHK